MTCRFARWFAAFALLCAFAGATAPLAAAEALSVTFADHVGLAWEDELVHHRVELPTGALTGAANTAVRNGEGEAVPAQVSGVTRHADGSVRALDVWFFVSLEPGEEKTFTLHPGAEMAIGGHPVGVSETAEQVELATGTPAGRIAVQLPAGGRTWNWPAPAAAAPAPIAGLVLPSGATLGAGRVQAPFRVKSFTTEVTATGPLFAEAQVRYLFDRGYWTFTARVVKDCPMLIFEEEFNTGASEQAYDEIDRFLVLPLTGADFLPTQAYFVSRAADERFQDLLAGKLQPITKEVGSLGRNAMSAIHGFGLGPVHEETFYYLTPFPTWSPLTGTGARLLQPGGDAVGLASLDGTRWRNPLSPRLRLTETGRPELVLPIQRYEQSWVSEGFGRNSPNATGKTLFVPENTCRRHWGLMLTAAEDEQEALIGSLIGEAVKLGDLPLDRVHRWTLDWPDPLAGADWAGETGEAGAQALEFMRGYIRFKRELGHRSAYSMWNWRSVTHQRYDAVAAVIDDPAALTWPDRQALRHLCAFQAHDLNSTGGVPWGVGVHLGNPNMSIMAMHARAKASLLVPDHPRFNEWAAWTVAFMQDYIHRYTRPSGAPYENNGYTHGVTLNELTEVNEFMLAAGLGDALDTPRFKACMRFLFHWLTPPDVRFQGHRLLVPFGNGSQYNSIPVALGERLVGYYRERDPELAGKLQWYVNQTLREEDRLDLVASRVPVLGSHQAEEYGVFFRHGFGTPYETYLHLMAGNCDGHYELETDQMTYSLYAKGHPIHLHFGNGYFPMFNRPWLRNRVSFDMSVEKSERNPTTVPAVLFQDEADYCRAVREVDMLRQLQDEYPVLDKRGIRWAPEEQQRNWTRPLDWETIPLTLWHRQILFVKDADPAGPNYFVLGESFGGVPTKPTELSLWFLAESMEREGDRYHFVGQAPVDMDVFVNTPAGAEPHTDRYGHVMPRWGDKIQVAKEYRKGKWAREEQLLLRLKQPTGEGYLVVLYPRLQENDPPATFTRLAPRVVRVQTTVSDDIALLSAYPFTWTGEGIDFKGNAAVVRRYPDGHTLVLNQEGRATITVQGQTIRGQGPFRVELSGEKTTATPLAEDAEVEVTDAAED